MIPFTTPKHTFRFGWSASLFTKVRIVYKQDDIVVLEKELNDCVVDGNSLILRLSQEDTAKFKNNIKRNFYTHNIDFSFIIVNFSIFMAIVNFIKRQY